jgi:hypothetical protein
MPPYHAWYRVLPVPHLVQGPTVVLNRKHKWCPEKATGVDANNYKNVI